MFLLPQGLAEARGAASGPAMSKPHEEQETTPELPTFFGAAQKAALAAAPAANSRLRVGGGRLTAAGPGRARAPRNIFGGGAAASSSPGPSANDAPLTSSIVPDDGPLSSVLRTSTAKKALTAATRPPKRDLRKPTRDARDVAVTLQWKGGGAAVSVVGSFTDWTDHIPMEADGPNSHFVTLHLRAGEHKYLFEVNGVLCVADEQPLIDVPRGEAPAHVVNVLEVDDGREYDADMPTEPAAAATSSPEAAVAEPTAAGFGAPMQFGWKALGAKVEDDEFSSAVPTNLIRTWLAPPSLPAHLHAMHGVARKPRRAMRTGPPPPCHVDLHHLRFERTAEPTTSEDGDSYSGFTPADGLAADVHMSDDDGGVSPHGSPRTRRACAQVPVTKITTTTRYREKRVTAVLYKPQPTRAVESFRAAAGARRTASLVELPQCADEAMLDGEQPCALAPATTPVAAPSPRASRTPSDVSMDAGDADEEAHPPSSPPAPAQPAAQRALFGAPMHPPPPPARLQIQPVQLLAASHVPVVSAPIHFPRAHAVPAPQHQPLFPHMPSQQPQPGVAMGAMYMNGPVLLASVPTRAEVPMAWHAVNLASVLGAPGRV